MWKAALLIMRGLASYMTCISDLDMPGVVGVFVCWTKAPECSMIITLL